MSLTINKEEIRLDENDILVAILEKKLKCSDIDAYRADQGIMTTGERFDQTNAHIFGQRVLEEVEQQLVRQETPELWAFRTIPLRVNLPMGLLKDTVPYQRYAGQPKIMTGSSSDVPLVKYTVDEESQNVAIYSLAYDYTYTELELVAQASKSNLYAYARDIVAEKAMAVIELMDEYDHLLACFGDSTNGLEGFLNHSSVDVLNQVGTFDPYAQTQAEALHDWFIGTIRNTIRNATSLVSRPNYIAMTENLSTKLYTTYFSGSNGITAMDLIRKSMSDLGIMRIDAVVELDNSFLQQYGVAGAGVERLVIGQLDSSIVDRRMSAFAYNPWYPLQDGQGRVVKRAARSVRFKHPKKFLYVNHAQKP